MGGPRAHCARSPELRIREHLTAEDMVALRAFVARFTSREKASKALNVARETFDELLAGRAHTATLARVRKALMGGVE